MTDENKWSWSDTKLKAPQCTRLIVRDIKQLLINRGENMRKLKITKKLDLINYLKQKHSVNLNCSLENFTKKELFVELKLLGLFHKNNVKSKRKQWIIQKLQTSTPNRTNKTIPIIPWSHTEWTSPLIDRFHCFEIQQLLLTRGVKKTHLKQFNRNKYKLIEYLKEKCSVHLNAPLRHLTCKQIKLELKLLQTSSNLPMVYQDFYTKDTLLQLLKAALNRQIETRFFSNLKHDEIPCNHFANLVKLNNDEFLIATKKNGFYKYNALKNEWMEWMMYPADFDWSDISCKTLCFDKINKIIYIYYGSKMLVINYECNTYQLYTSLPWLKEPKLLFVNNQVHLFGNLYFRAPSHWIWDDDACKFNKCYNFQTYGGKLLHIPSKNLILKLGGSYIHGYDVTINQRWAGNESYDVTNKRWLISKRRMPNINFYNRHGGFYCLTRNEQYLIINKMYENICVLDLNEMRLMPTDIKWPSGKYYEGIIMNDTLNQELIVFGFVRLCWDKYKIGEHSFPPIYIIKLMQSWYSEEYLHIIYSKARAYYGDTNQPFKKHLKIRVDDIVANALQSYKAKNNV